MRMEDILVQSSAFSDKAAVTTGKFVLLYWVFRCTRDGEYSHQLLWNFKELSLWTLRPNGTDGTDKRHYSVITPPITSCPRGDTICPRPSPPPVRAPASRASPSRRNVAVISHAEYVPTLTAAAALCVKAALSKAAWWPWPLTFWPWNGVRVTFDVGYLCANFGFPIGLCSRVRPDEPDRHQTDRRQKKPSLNAPRIRGGHKKGITKLPTCSFEVCDTVCPLWHHTPVGPACTIVQLHALNAKTLQTWIDCVDTVTHNVYICTQLMWVES